jgi:exopolyphosphatase/guanosine-5'-triphosphate,3'-diphosphate pyrophosphatase
VKFSVNTSRSDSSCPRTLALQRWTRRKLGTIDHELRVKSITGKLFDLTWPLHAMSRADRELLQMAAIVHDVGRYVDDATHPKQGAAMLHNAQMLPLSATERRALMYLTRHHRGEVPALGEDQILRATDDRETLLKLLALLRAADALDSRVIESPSLVFKLNHRRLNVTCCLNELTAKALQVYGRRKKFRLLEDVLQLHVQVRIVATERLRVVA